jgi:hypothetical protein
VSSMRRNATDRIDVRESQVALAQCAHGRPLMHTHDMEMVFTDGGLDCKYVCKCGIETHDSTAALYLQGKAPTDAERHLSYLMRYSTQGTALHQTIEEYSRRIDAVKRRRRRLIAEIIVYSSISIAAYAILWHYGRWRALIGGLVATGCGLLMRRKVTQ